MASVVWLQSLIAPSAPVVLVKPHMARHNARMSCWSTIADKLIFVHRYEFGFTYDNMHAHATALFQKIVDKDNRITVSGPNISLSGVSMGPSSSQDTLSAIETG